MGTTYTLSGQLGALVDGPSSSIHAAYVRTNLPAGAALIDKTATAKSVNLGIGRIDLDKNTGSFSVDLLGTANTGLNVVANTLRYEVIVEYANPGQKGLRTWSSGFFPLTANTDIKVVAVDVEPMAVASASQYALEAKQYRDEAAAIADLTGEDSAVAVLVEDEGTLTGAAVAAKVNTAVTTAVTPLQETVDEGRLSEAGLSATIGAATAPLAETAEVPAIVAESERLAVAEQARAAAVLRVDFTTKRASRANLDRPWAACVSGSGALTGEQNPAYTNLLPTLTGSNVGTNTLPAGWEFHIASATKTIETAGTEAVSWRGVAGASSTDLMGGIRTFASVVQSGKSYLLALDAEVRNDTALAATLAAEIVSRTNRTALVTWVEDAGRAVARIDLPSETPGSEPTYKFGVTLMSRDLTAGQSARVTLSRATLIEAPTTYPTRGEAWAAPKFVSGTKAASSVTLAPGAPAGNYYVLFRTDEWGWAAETVSLASETSTIAMSSIVGSAAVVTLREVLVVPVTAWVDGWLDALDPPEGPGALASLPYLNRSTAALSMPESLALVQRATGGHTVPRIAVSGADDGIPRMRTPPTFDVFRVGKTRASRSIAKTAGVPSIEESASASRRSEVEAGRSMPFGTEHWISMRVRPLDTFAAGDLPGSPSEYTCLIAQTRYVNNATGDASALSPDLSVELLAGSQWQIRYRTDGGTPVLSGSAMPAGVTTRTLPLGTYEAGEWRSLVIRVTYSDTGGGNLGVWLDGAAIFDGATPIGYDRNVGPRFRWGIYKFFDKPIRCEYQHVEFGTRNLADRIANPLPV